MYRVHSASTSRVRKYHKSSNPYNSVRKKELPPRKWPMDVLLNHFYGSNGTTDISFLNLYKQPEPSNFMLLASKNWNGCVKCYNSTYCLQRLVSLKSVYKPNGIAADFANVMWVNVWTIIQKTDSEICDDLLRLPIFNAGT